MNLTALLSFRRTRVYVVLLFFAAACDPTGPGVSESCDPGVLTVTPATLLLKGSGATATLQAEIRDPGSQPASCEVVWKSLNPAVATLSAVGEVTAERDGQAVLRAAADGRVAYALATVAVGGMPPEQWVAASQPTAADLNGVWGSSPDNVFAVGDSGTIIYFDGVSWTPQESGTAADLHDVWGWAGDEVWAVGDSGTILRNGGSGWAAANSRTTSNLAAVWGPSPDEVYAVGGEILRYNGTDWQSLGSTSATYRDIWGAAPGTVYLTGVVLQDYEDSSDREAVIHRLDGTELHSVTIPYPTDREGVELKTDLFAIHGTAPDHIVAVGEARSWVSAERTPYLLRYDGGAWSILQSSDSLGSLAGVWMTSPETGYTVGRRGQRTSEVQILTASDSVWDRVDLHTPGELRSIWGSGSELFAVGTEGTIVRRGGGGWRVAHRPLPPMRAVWGAHAEHVIAVGEGAALHYDGSEWYPEVERFRGQVPAASLMAVWGTSETHAVAVGSTSGVFGFDDGGWKGLAYLTDTDTLFGVWGNAPDEIVTVGNEGAIYRSTGTGDWEAVESGTNATLRGVWGFGRDQKIVVGDNGTVLRYDGTGWAAEESGTVVDLTAVWGSDPDSLYAIGAAGTVLRSDSNGWLSMTTPTTTRLHAIWGTAADNVYAAGVGGLLLHYDGSDWRTLETGTTVDLWGLWGSIEGWWAVSPTDPAVLVRGGGS